MFKNVASQTIDLFVFDYSTGAPKTGDAANLTAYLSKDDGTLTALTDTSGAEISSTNAPGWYRFDVSQSESNANKLLFTGKSSTANATMVGKTIYTRPQYAADTVISSGGIVSANVTAFGGSNGTFSGGRPEVNTTHAAGTAWGSGAITAGSLATGAITAAKFAAGAIDAAALATDAATEIATAALTTQMTQSYRADGAAPTLAQGICEILGHLGESSISGTTKTVKQFDGSTSAMTFTLDDATTPTSITRAT